jgi:hypothetical protein
MAYTITITSMDVIKSHDGLSDVVKTIHFDVASQVIIDGISYNVASGDRVFIPDPNPTAFTPYADLQAAEVIAWIESNYDVVDMVERLGATFREQIAPTITTRTPPWEA